MSWTAFLQVLLGILLVVDCILLLLVVLIQSGSGGGLASTFGGGAEESILGARGNVTLNRLTSIFAAGFMILCCILAYLGTRERGSVTDRLPGAQAPKGSPASLPEKPDTNTTPQNTGDGAKPTDASQPTEGTETPAPKATEGTPPEEPKDARETPKGATDTPVTPEKKPDTTNTGKTPAKDDGEDALDGADAEKP